jgi:hypothetical protein
MIRGLAQMADERLRAIGLSLDLLTSAASGVFVFGSRADGSASASSDLDILCIGNGRRMKRAGLDVVWVSPRHLLSQVWLGSELATHVARFGICLRGDASWTLAAWPDADAVALKRATVEAEHLAMLRLWEQLAPEYRRKHMSSVRRNLQRLERLSRGEAVPPTPHLDAEWRRRGGTDDLDPLRQEMRLVLGWCDLTA